MNPGQSGARRPRSLAARLRLQFATATLAAAAGTGLGFLYAHYALGANASRTLTAMYASFGAVAALVALRVGALTYHALRDR